MSYTQPMTNFADKLTKAVRDKKSPICLGLDPHMSMIPHHIKEGKKEPEIILHFLKEIIDACHTHTAIVKPNIAFFEEWGHEGIRVFEEICAYAKLKDLLVLVDAKRGDIGSTAEAYARYFLTKDIFDAITINPYLGEDSVRPFIDEANKNGKGLFVLVKTSNPSSAEFQDLHAEGQLMHEHVAQAVSRWGMDFLGESKLSLLGAVVGATHPEDISHLRQEMPTQIFLIPGYGAQGGKAEDLFPAFYKGGSGAIVNSSRGILFASQGEDFAEKSEEAIV